MKIVIDDKIPFIKGVFEPHAEVVYLSGAAITREHLSDVDGLLIRTRTFCDQRLLQGTPVKFIGTATIGFDHIDTRWCEAHGIQWTNAPGCNSGGVSQYITAALLEMSHRLGFNLKGKTLGIIGVGHVGKKVWQVAREMGMNVLLNDPPRARREGPDAFTELPVLLHQSDLITVHVPLNREGQDKTFQMIDHSFLAALKPGTVLINASRGEVLDEAAALQWMTMNTNHLSLVLDVWPHEPEINRELLKRASIATPHIAGYSVEGKYNATRKMVESVSEFFRLDLPPLAPLVKDGKVMTQNGPLADYDIMADDRRLRESPETFEQQRNNYPKRWEYSSEGR